jgi:four helix bundle protein
MAHLGFEDLKVYQLSEEIADSIGANIAEGHGRGSFQDNRRFIRIARGSLNETKHWLRRAHRHGLLSPDQIATLKPLLNELPPRLNAYLRSVGPVSDSTNDQGQLTKDEE